MKFLNLNPGPPSLKLRNTGGQAIIEYVLVLIVVVSLILGLSIQFFKPMETFMQSYLGTYVECLLETGSLPYAGESINSTKDKGCTFAKLQGGDRLSGGSNRSNGSNGSNDSNESNGANGDRSGSDRNKNGSSAENGSSSGGNSASGSSRYSSRSGFNRLNGKGLRDGGMASGNNKVIEIALAGDGSGGFFSSRSSQRESFSRRKSSYVPLTGLTEEERKKIEKLSEKSAGRIVATSEFGPTTKKIAVKKPEPKVVVQEDSEPLTVGNFIRYLFIGALIIALVIFIGGQALSMSKEN